MRDEAFLQNRRSVRLKQFDYAQPGPYFLTICLQDRQPLFGKVVGRDVALSPLGRIANDCWLEIPSHFPAVRLGPHVVMPDHIHGLLINTPAGDARLAKDARRARYIVPLRPDKTVREFGAPAGGSIATIVLTFKAAVSRKARWMCRTPSPLWQRGFYEHVIRGANEYRNACAYIRTNPARHTFAREFG